MKGIRIARAGRIEIIYKVVSIRPTEKATFEFEYLKKVKENIGLSEQKKQQCKEHSDRSVPDTLKKQEGAHGDWNKHK